LILRDPRSKARHLIFSRDSGTGMVALSAKPCPFLEGRSTCAIYDIRPYNCRRFGCFRPNPAVEPFEEGSGPLGCLNFAERFAVSRVVRRAAASIQRKAQVWARAHGWSE
jgi:Fe-S-cluster containining protein